MNDDSVPEKTTDANTTADAPIKNEQIGGAAIITLALIQWIVSSLLKKNKKQK